MTALTANRNTPARDGKQFSFPVAASTKIYQGSLVCLDMDVDVGLTAVAAPAYTAAWIVCVGRAEEEADNSAGLAGEISVKVSRGCFLVANAGDITTLHIGSSCYLVDDQTVSASSATATRSIAGIIRDVVSDGVWVEI